MVDDKHYAGYSSTAGGLCLVGGNGCDTGQVNPEHAGRSTGIEYQSVQGGCGNCIPKGRAYTKDWRVILHIDPH